MLQIVSLTDVAVSKLCQTLSRQLMRMTNFFLTNKPNLAQNYLGTGVSQCQKQI